MVEISVSVIEKPYLLKYEASLSSKSTISEEKKAKHVRHACGVLYFSTPRGDRHSIKTCLKLKNLYRADYIFRLRNFFF